MKKKKTKETIIYLKYYDKLKKISSSKKILIKIMRFNSYNFIHKY
jgi:hypothetical protein